MKGVGVIGFLNVEIIVAVGAVNVVERKGNTYVGQFQGNHIVQGIVQLDRHVRAGAAVVHVVAVPHVAAIHGINVDDAVRFLEIRGIHLALVLNHVLDAHHLRVVGVGDEAVAVLKQGVG